MVYRVVAERAHILKRSAAVLIVVAAASGCSSSASRFTDGLPTASTSSSQQAASLAPAAQPYPGDRGLDTTYTGSVNRAAVEPAQTKPRFWQRTFRAPVPTASVGSGGMAPAPVQQPYPVAAQPQPYPTAPQPFPTASTGTVARAPMAAPMPATVAAAPLAPAMVDPAPTGSIAPAQPAGANMITVRAGDTIASLANRYGVSADRLASANGLQKGSALSAGQKLAMPAFGTSGAAPSTAPAPAPQVAAKPAPLPGDKPKAPVKEPERVAVLPQQARPAERSTAGTDATTAGALYTVKSGDTLSAIAKRHGTTAAAIRSANGMESGIIRVGQKLVLPGTAAKNVASAPARVDPVVTSTTPASQLSGYTPPQRKVESVVQDAVASAAPAPDATGIGRMRWPVVGKVISGYGDTRGPKPNDGIDIAVPEGTPVKAAENGVVIYAGDGLKDFGNTVLVRHENGLVTVYGHASELKVARGETVRRGQEIARSGVSGNAGTPKLHFEVRKDSAPVDPAKHLE